MQGSTGLVLRGFESRAAASQALANEIFQTLSGVLQRSGAASFVASGGGSPKETYQQLSRLPLDWEKVSILPSDERCVAEDSPRSNLGMIRTHLPVNARFIELNESSPIHTLRPFDVVLLGMGEDGHTASLFPKDPGIEAALSSDVCLHQCHPPGMPEARISLTPVALLDANCIFLLIFGGQKRERLDAALAGGPVHEYPVRILLHDARIPTQVYWAP